MVGHNRLAVVIVGYTIAVTNEPVNALISADMRSYTLESLQFSKQISPVIESNRFSAKRTLLAIIEPNG